MKNQKKKSFPRRVFLCLLAVLLAVYVAFGIYVSDYYHADLTDSGLRVYAAYGSEDGVLNRKKYEADRTNLPQDTTETVIDGGCHAGFGSYGAQEGRWHTHISAEKHSGRTADALAAWMKEQYGGTMIQALKTVLPIKQKEYAKVKKHLRLLLTEEESREKLAFYQKKNQKARARLLEALMEVPVQDYELVTKN